MARSDGRRADDRRRTPSTSVRDDPDARRAVHASRELLEALFGPPRERTFAVRFWTGEEDRPPGEPRFTLILRRPDALRRMLLPPTERALGEAYLRDDCDVEGDLESAARTFRRLLERPPPAARLPALLLRLLDLPGPATAGESELPEGPGRRGARHSRERDSRAVRFHYDAGNRFFDLWLDPYMQYSCAYFPSGEESLEDAQEAKLDMLCRKLRLEPGDRLLDIGCGWGGLIRFAAERYGVRALGVTLSDPQARRARRDLNSAGLGDRCEVRVEDYRDLGDERFDAAVSVGMVEHVGRSRLGRYFRRVHRLLPDGGHFLNVGIVDLAPPRSPLRRAFGRLLAPFTSFVDRYVFPDGELVAPSERLGPAEQAGFELRHAENLREHYAETLRRWVARLESSREPAVRRTDRVTYRTWRLYMAASAHAFASGRLGLLHGLYVRR